MVEQSNNTRRRRVGLAALTPLALLASSFVVYQASNAAFTASTANGSNTWSTGNVVLTDDDTGQVMFNLSGIKPNDTGSKCVNVTYSGNLASNVRLYATAPGGNGLGQYLDFTVEEGTGATGGSTMDCTGFTGPTTLFTGTLDAFATTKTNHATGVSTWAPATTASKSYKFTWTLQDNNAAQNKNASATFTWEARNA